MSDNVEIILNVLLDYVKVARSNVRKIVIERDAFLLPGRNQLVSL